MNQRPFHVKWKTINPLEDNIENLDDPVQQTEQVLSPQNSYVEILTCEVMVLREAFGILGGN